MVDYAGYEFFSVSRPLKENFHQTLLKRIAASPDFPAFARTVQEAYRVIENDLASATELVNLILRDPALTHRILRLANAVEYRHRGGQVTTISRAVTLMGFEEIRMAALAMSLFEQIECKQHGKMLQSRFLQALYQAFLAQNLARHMGGFSVEEMFLSALFQDFGALLIYRHAPEVLPDIERARNGDKLDESSAIHTVTGVLPAALARDVCQQWGLPESAKRFLTTRASTGKIAGLNPTSKAQAIGRLANETAAIMANATNFAQMQQEMDELVRAAGIDRALYQEAVNEARDHILEYESMLNQTQGKPAFLQRMSMEKDDQLPTDTPPGAESGEQRSEVLTRCIEDITAKLMSEYTLGDVFALILKAMAEGLNLDLAVLYMLDRNNWQLTPKMGEGALYARLRSQMNISLKENGRIAQAFLSAEDRALPRPALPSDDIADWQYSGHSDMGEVLPLYINRTPFGLIYLEGKRSVFHEGNANSLRTLRNQAILAVKSKSAR